MAAVGLTARLSSAWAVPGICVESAASGRPHRGEFYIRNWLTRYQRPFYGPLAFGTGERSAVLTDSPADG
jgi:hypothetical protein